MRWARPSCGEAAGRRALLRCRRRCLCAGRPFDVRRSQRVRRRLPRFSRRAIRTPVTCPTWPTWPGSSGRSTRPRAPRTPPVRPSRCWRRWPQVPAEQTVAQRFTLDPSCHFLRSRLSGAAHLAGSSAGLRRRRDRRVRRGAGLPARAARSRRRDHRAIAAGRPRVAAHARRWRRPGDGAGCRGRRPNRTSTLGMALRARIANRTLAQLRGD